MAASQAAHGGSIPLTRSRLRLAQRKTKRKRPPKSCAVGGLFKTIGYGEQARVLKASLPIVPSTVYRRRDYWKGRFENARLLAVADCLEKSAYRTRLRRTLPLSFTLR